jgi:hypothetical protein
MNVLVLKCNTKNRLSLFGAHRQTQSPIRTFTSGGVKQPTCPLLKQQLQTLLRKHGFYATNIMFKH